MAFDDFCVTCGQESDLYHAFQPPVRPEGCVCDPLSYQDPSNVPNICGEYKGGNSGSSDRYCLECEHDYECHMRSK